MDDEDGNFDGGDRADQFHRNEAISAVADDGFLGEEEEDDYEDLYNDVNVGEGFLQTLKPEDEVDDSEKKIEPLEPPPVSIPGIGGSGGGGSGDGRAVKREDPEGDSKPPPPPPKESIFRGNETGARVPAMKIEMGESSSSKFSETRGQFGNSNPQSVVGGNSFASASASANNANANGGGGGPAVGVGPAPSSGVGGVPGSSGAGGTVLYVGELHWWTTDAELESELSKYGAVKELKFYDEKASGKSKGYCQVEFYDPAAAAACKEGMNGHVFNGRPCVVAFASPMTVRRMGEAMMNKNHAITASQQGPSQGRRGHADGGKGSGIGLGANFQNFGRGGWPRGGGAMGNRGPIGSMRNRVGMGGRGIIGNNGNGFGQGLPAPPPPLLQPHAMMVQGFDPTYGTPMGRMGGGYGGFPGAPVPPFSGVLSSFPGVGGVGLPGLAPHVNPAFFGRGMPANGMGMMPAPGVENAGMWSDPSVGGWASEEQGGRAGESGYGEDALSEQQYGETGHDRGWSNAAREKDRASERDLSGGALDRKYRDDREPGWDREATKERDTGRDQDWSERRHRDDREAGWDRDRDRDRDRYREDRERYSDHHRYRDRDMEHDDEWDRARPARSHHSKSRLSHEEEQRQKPRAVEHGKRRRLPSE